MLDRLSQKEWYCLLDWYSRYKQISITSKDQEKTTLTFPYETFAFKRMQFGLSNAPATFQCCMLYIFVDMVKDSMEVFMDDFSIVGDMYDKCLANFRHVLQLG